MKGWMANPRDERLLAGAKRRRATTAAVEAGMEVFTEVSRAPASGRVIWKFHGFMQKNKKKKTLGMGALELQSQSSDGGLVFGIRPFFLRGGL